MPGEAGTATHKADAGRGQRQQVGAHRHRADDQDGVDLNHAKPRDHAGRHHEDEIARDRPSVGPGLPEHVCPDQARHRVAGSDRPDLVEPGERDVLSLQPSTQQVLQDRVGRLRMNLCGQ